MIWVLFVFCLQIFSFAASISKKEELSKMSLSELKTLLENNDIDCSACKTREHYLRVALRSVPLSNEGSDNSASEKKGSLKESNSEEGEKALGRDEPSSGSHKENIDSFVSDLKAMLDEELAELTPKNEMQGKKAADDVGQEARMDHPPVFAKAAASEINLGEKPEKTFNKIKDQGKDYASKLFLYTSRYWEIFKELGAKYGNVALINAQVYGKILWHESQIYGKIGAQKTKEWSKRGLSASKDYGARACRHAMRFGRYLYSKSCEGVGYAKNQYKEYKAKKNK